MSTHDTDTRYREDLFDDHFPPNKGTLFEGNLDVCEPAQAFLATCHGLYQEGRDQTAGVFGRPNAPVGDRRSALRILADIELRLQRLFWQKIRAAPRRCQRRGLERQGHCCVLVVFEAYQAQLEQLQASFAGSVLDLPEREVVKETQYVPTPVPAVEFFGKGVDVE